MKDPSLIGWTTDTEQLVRRRLEMLVLSEALVGCQCPQTLIEDDFSVALIIVKAIPFLTYMLVYGTIVREG